MQVNYYSFGFLERLHLVRQRLLLCEPSLGLLNSARPIVLGLGHSMSLVDVLVPVLVGIGSTVEVELGVIKELSSLGNIHSIFISLSLVVLVAYLLVLLLGQTSRDV